MIGRQLTREHIYYCGDYMDVQVFPVFQTQKYQRKKKYRPTSAAQKLLNQRNREDKLRRLVHLNFTHRDYVICPTYAEGMRESTPENLFRFEKDWNNFRRRLKTLYKKHGIELKYVRSPEFAVRTGYHAHIILSGGVSMDEIKKCWGKGRCYTDTLEFDENGVAGLCRYISKDPILGKMWCASKNLLQPEPKEYTGRIEREHLFSFRIEDRETLEAMYPGYKCTDVRWEVNDINGGQYAAARFYKIGTKFYYDT